MLRAKGEGWYMYSIFKDFFGDNEQHMNKQTLGFSLQLFTGPLRLNNNEVNNNNVLTTTASNAWHLSLMNYFETNVTNWLMDLRLKSAHLHHIVFQVDEWLCVCVCVLESLGKKESSPAVITIGSLWPERHLLSNLSERRSSSPAVHLMGLFL